jgi:hypothetical protein
MEDVRHRLQQLREFCERNGFDCVWSEATRQEPSFAITIRAEGMGLTCRSADSMVIALARMENTLLKIGRARADVYLNRPHGQMGSI